MQETSFGQELPSQHLQESEDTFLSDLHHFLVGFNFRRSADNVLNMLASEILELVALSLMCQDEFARAASHLF